MIRCKVDGSSLHLFAMGLRNPYRGLAFDGSFTPFLFDGGDDDGSKFQGVRLISPAEEGDYGWRLRPGVPSGPADFDRAAMNGERSGKLPGLARLGRGSPSGVVAYNGTSLPEVLRGTLIEPDPSRQIVRGYQVEPKGGSHHLKGELTLLSAEDDQFRPCQASIGADGAIYVLDRRGRDPAESPPWGEGKTGRLYRLTWEGGETHSHQAPAQRLEAASPGDRRQAHLRAPRLGRLRRGRPGAPGAARPGPQGPGALAVLGREPIGGAPCPASRHPGGPSALE